MAATYLLRFDDFCPTMNWTIWREVEAALIDSGVRPMLAVVPDNQDPELKIEPARDTFWEEVRSWQSRGWTIGLHGFQHRYVTTSAGIIGRNRYSEFAGLPYPAQLEKVRSGLAIFARQGVRPDVWVAPAHSFDSDTLCALNRCGLRAVSDGYFMLPHTDDNGMFWVPQQIGRFRQLPIGVWTVCLHHNTWSMDDVHRFRGELKLFRDRMADFSQVVNRYSRRPEKWMDRMSAGLMGMARLGRFAISRGGL
jgi:peptidoglycan/xylan/chitin deacetylase (PgdA/CDA1 family)